MDEDSDGLLPLPLAVSLSNLLAVRSPAFAIEEAPDKPGG